MSIHISLHVEHRHVYIVGGGSVALRKSKQFLNEGAFVHVIAISCLDEFSQLSIDCIQQRFSWDLMKENAFLLYAATDDETLNHSLMIGCKERNILCGSATQDKDCDFHSMMSLQGDYLQLALSTNGTCPGATKTLLSKLAKPFEELHQRSELVARIRQKMPSIQGDVLALLSTLTLDHLESIVNAYERNQPMLMLVYHGIANYAAMESSLFQMKHQILDKFPHLQVVSVFESVKIAQKARKKGHDVDTYETMLSCLTSLHLTYLVQPMLLQRGEWYSRLISQNHPIGECLLETMQEVEHLYHIIKTSNKHRTILCVYHDSHENLFQRIAPLDNDVFLPLSKLSTTPIHYSYIIPLFIFMGYHASQIIERYTDTETAYDNKGLLDYPKIQAMFLNKISKFVSKAID